MKKLNQLSIIAVVTVVFGLSSGRVAAQAPPGGGNADAQQFQQQMQQRIMGYLREQLAVTNDDEWGVIEGRLSKVVQARMEVMLGGMGGFRGMMGGGRRGFPGFGGQPSPEADALQKAIESNAPADEVRVKLAKYREVRKQKEASLTKAQDDLRQVLSLHQEGTAVLMGLLP
jgi:hypothetical protein